MSYKVALSLLMTAFIGGSAIAEPSRLEEALASLQPETEVVEETPEIEEAPIVEEVKPEPRWVGANFTENEAKALNFFQDYGIEDRMALAVLLGNIQQESRFTPNICEGGARIPYSSCHRGGYGLIQWTTTGRYDGLGRHARNRGTSPSIIDTQLSYLVTEREWKEALWRFKTPDRSLDFYMKGAYRWLGWGIYGNRGYYSQQYYDRLSLK